MSSYARRAVIGYLSMNPSHPLRLAEFVVVVVVVAKYLHPYLALVLGLLYAVSLAAEFAVRYLELIGEW